MCKCDIVYVYITCDNITPPGKRLLSFLFSSCLFRTVSFRVKRVISIDKLPNKNEKCADVYTRSRGYTDSLHFYCDHNI